ncbi:MAG: ACT domain-containing protein [Firmicutes bacterium]|nr:ACT domain-containing protein [Bacillota bacterium]MBR6351999.1 ACT domain-containing protein [Bacillota bacterium]
MNAIITVIGHDKVGIIAAVCNLLANYNINVLEISQTILRGNFTMIMTVDIAKASAALEDIGTALEELGRDIDLTIRIQREDLFDAMYNI